MGGGGGGPLVDVSLRAAVTTRTYVALAGDSSVYVGLVTAVSSILTTTPSAEIYVIVDEPKEVSAAMACVAAEDRVVRIVHFDRRHVAHLSLKAPTGRAYGNLETPLNFARFYLADLLPAEVDVVVYLDADVVVLRDLAHLVAGLPAVKKFAVAAVPRVAQQACYSANVSRPGMFYCDDQHNRDLLARHGIVDPERQLSSFNAGVAVFNLKVWRSKQLSRRAEFWITKHAAHPLWRLGSNPPLVLVANSNLFEPITNVTWNCDGLGWKKPIYLEASCLQHGANIWHWSGPRKPWLPNGYYKALWWPHLTYPACLTHLPPAPPQNPPPTPAATTALAAHVLSTEAKAASSGAL